MSILIPEKVEVPKISLVDRVRLPSKETALVIVDMQNDFAHPNGKLFVKSSRDIVPNIRRLLESARRVGARVVYTKDSHSAGDPVEFPIWGQHAVRGTWGWEIIDELKPEPNDLIIEKPRYDAFFGTPLDHLLRAYGIRNLVVVGVVANICVLHTVASAALNLYKTYVPVDAIAAVNQFDYVAALRQMDFLYKAVLTTSNVVEFV